MAKYKIEKKYSRYFIYRKGIFFWKLLKTEWSQADAEKFIVGYKEYLEQKKKYPELIGYY